MSLQKDYDVVVDSAIQQGWKVRHASGRRNKRLVSPDGFEFPLPNNPRDYRGLKNFKAELVRAGWSNLNDRYTSPLIRKPKEPKVETPQEEIAVVVKTIEDRKQDHTASGAARRILRENPDKTYGIDDMYVLVKGRVPSATRLSVQQAMTIMAQKGEATRAGRGLYRWGEKPKINGHAPEPTPPPASLPNVKLGDLTGDSTLDADLELIDQALAALGEIEAVVRRVHEKIHKLAELKKVLG